MAGQLGSVTSLGKASPSDLTRYVVIPKACMI